MKCYTCAPWTALLVGLSAFLSSQVAQAEAFRPQGTEAILLKEILIDNLPRKYEEKPNWGKQVQIFDGFNVKGRGLKIKIEKKKKPVNHGLWQHYRAELSNPGEDLKVEIRDFVHRGGNRFTFTLFVIVKLDGYARFISYTNGIKLFSVDTDGKAEIHWTLNCEVFVTWHGTWMPELEIKPHVLSSELYLRNYTMERFGHLDGNLIREIGDGLERVMRKMLTKQDPKLVEAANKAIAKAEKEGKLRFSAKQWLAMKIPNFKNN